jgi:type IV fimbrial biogenesis protein FimT
MKRKQRGISLLELIVTAVLIAVTASIAAPNFKRMITNNDADNSIKRIYKAWQLAKNLALSNSKQIIICGSDDGTTCKKNWSNHILIFQDNNYDGAPSANELLYQQDINSSLGSIQTRIAFGKTYIILQSRGSAPLTGSFLYCNKKDPTSAERKATWNFAGRMYLSNHNSRNNSSRVTCK